MVQAQDDAIVKHFRIQLDALVGATVVRVPHDVAGRFRHRELELADRLFVERWRRQPLADIPDEGPHPRQLVQIARDVHLRTGEGQLALLNPHGDARQIVAERLRVRKGHGGLADLIDQRLGFELSVGSDTFGQTLYAEQLAVAISGFRQSIRVEEEDVAGLQ